MSVLPILFWPDPILSRKSAPVGVPGPDDLALAQAMLHTMYDAPGRGLAAPQVGILKRLFVMDTVWTADGDRAPRIFFDPAITARSDDLVPSVEGCLSIPGISAEVTRHAAVTLDWTDEHGARRSEALTGIDAICAQHEIDHLDGIVTLDRLSEAAREAALATYSLPA